MKMRTFIGLCAALAFAAGSTAVHAVKIVPGVNSNPAEGEDSIIYAAETLLKGTDDITPAKDEADETVYYNIGGETDLLHLRTGRCYGQCGGYLHCCLRVDRHGVPGRLGQQRRGLDTGLVQLGCWAGRLETRWRCSGWTALRGLPKRPR